jgi:hypothetical protein
VGDVVSDGWLDPWNGRGRPPGGSGTVEIVVTGLAEGDRSWHLRLADGVVVDVGAGGDATGSADVTLTLPAPVAEAVARGTLAASEAFMQGRMKTAGSQGLVLDVLAAVDGGVA